ncbi:hypothetical protein, partial [Campylobacter sp. MIT 97-5078]
VKVLSLDEMKEVKGGYIAYSKQIDNMEIAAYAVLQINALDYGIDQGSEITYDRNGNFVLNRSGVCSAGVTHCYMFNDTRTQYGQNIQRLRELMALVGDPVLNSIAFTVKARYIYTRSGKEMIFSYGAGVVNRQVGAFSRLPINVLETNFVVKDLRANYQGLLESMLKNQYR